MHEDELRRLYAAFEARDIDTAVAGMDRNVRWPNGWEGGMVIGREAVREYWTRQWAAVDSHVDPVSFARRGDDRVEVTVNQRILDLQGTLIAEGQVQHVYSFSTDGLVTEMEIVDV